MYKIYADSTLICSSAIEELAVINPVVELEANTAGVFTFTMPPTHPYYDRIERKNTLIDVYRDDDTEPLFEGVCVAIDVDFYKQKKFTCEGDLSFLNDSTLRPSYQHDKTSRQLLETYIAEHNSLVEPMKRFTVGQVTMHDSNDSITCYTNYNPTLTEIKEDLVDDLGGYIRLRHENGTRYIDYLADSPRTNSQVIRLGENLIDLAQNLNTDDLATVIIPLGHTLDTQSIAGLDERLNIKTAAADTYHPAGKDYVYSTDAVAEFGWLEKVVEWDNVTTVAALLSKGEQYLRETQFENLIIEARAIDLGLTSSEFQKFRILDQIRVISPPHGLNRDFMLSKMTVHLNNPEQDTITLGKEEKNKTLSAKSVTNNEAILREIEQLPTSNMVKSAINNATALITGAEGGYVVTIFDENGKPKEIRIQNALNNPTKIWRWNVNGFGYSNDGGATYSTAITMDGKIVADFITAGTMYADRIKGGTLTLGGLDNTNGILLVKKSNGGTAGQWDKDGIRLYNGTVGGWYISDSEILSIDGDTTAQSTKMVSLKKYNPNGVADQTALGVYVRNSTSDNWTAKFRIGYDGNIYSQEAIDFYPADNYYGAHVHGALSASGKLTSGNGEWIADANGNVSSQGGCYHAGSISGHVTDGRAGLNCTGGGLYVYGNIYADGSIGCGGSKPRIVHTKDYGYRQMNAYETCTPYFGDIGEGKLNTDGECIIYIDEIFSQTVDLDIVYQVFLQKYGQGNAWVESREADHFTVKGTPNLVFGWEIKAVQLGYDYMRCNTPDDTMMATILEKQAQEGV